MMKLVTFLIIASKYCCIELTSANMFTPDIGPSTDINFADCILNISRRYFDNTLPVAIQMSSMYHKKYESNSNEKQLLHALCNENEFSHITLGLIGDMDNVSVYSVKTGNEIKYGSYLLVLSGSSIRENFDLAFKMIQRIFIGKNHKSKLIMVLTNTLSLHEQGRHAKKLLRYSFRVGFAFNVVIAPTTILRSNLQQLNIFGWNPNLQTNICSTKLDIINLLDIWNFEQRAFVLNVDLFPEYRFVDMKGCKLVTAIGDYYPFIFPFSLNNKVNMEGSFYHFIVIIEKLLNCKIHLGPPHMSIDIMHAQFPVFISTELQINDCGWVYPYYTVDHYWYVPSPLEIPRWRSLIRAFKPEMWVFILLVFTIGTLILFYLQKFAKKSDSKNKSISLTDQLLSSMKTYLGISTSVHYRGKIAMATFLWLYYCLVINTAYQSALFGLIVNPGHYQPIETLMELDESGLEKVTEYHTYKVDQGGPYSLYYNKFPVCSDTVYSCFKKIAKERLQTVLASSYVGKKAMEEFTEGAQIVPVREKYFTMYLVVQISDLSCVLHKPMEITLRRLVSAGLIQRWNEAFSITERRRVTLNNVTSPVFAFGLTHLYGVFYICILGLVLAFIIFLTEILLPAFHQGFT
ncbi:Ionotropic receptor 533 [Blattella germanica]|nr:Ionotropic receptor 533 [Blattella germanica]